MIEVPAAIYQIALLAKKVAFFPLGRTTSRSSCWRPTG